LEKGSCNECNSDQKKNLVDLECVSKGDPQIRNECNCERNKIINKICSVLNGSADENTQ
jgi:hypothetical protein